MSPRRRPKRTTHENHERWLLTYADLITLLLAFFVVMYSMSRLDAKKFGAMSEALSGILQGRSVPRVGQYTDRRGGGGPLKTGRLRLMQSQLQQQVGMAGLNSSVSSEMTDRGLVIHIREGALFEEAKADLTPGARDVLRMIGEELSAVTNHIRVEGHTDARPISTVRFPSNWELSTARATAVLRYLVDSAGVNTEHISAIGYGEFRPVAANISESEMARNRRVDIVILTEEMARSEPTVSPELLGQRAGESSSTPSAESAAPADSHAIVAEPMSSLE